MRTFRHISEIPEFPRGCALSIGKFDGVHIGHAAILTKTIEIAKELNVPTVAFTFDPTPAQLLSPSTAPQALYDREQKVEIFEKFGLDYLILFETTHEFLKTTADEFFDDVVIGKFHARALIEGYNFCFGRGAEGDCAYLRRRCYTHGIRFEVAERRYVDAVGVSSSLIRRHIASGEIDWANLMLGRPYELRGYVRHGEARGRLMNYPTANLCETTTVLPQLAVYAAYARLDDGRTFPAAVNLGANPTFGVSSTKIEAHLLDFDGADLYDRPMRLYFLKKIRDIVKCRDMEELRARLDVDVVCAREIYRSFFPNGTP